MCEGQGSLACCSPWDCKESDMTWLLNNNIYISIISLSLYLYPIGYISLKNPENYKAKYCLLDFKVICLLFLHTNGNFSSGVTLISTQRQPWQNPSKIAPSVFVGRREAKSPTGRVWNTGPAASCLCAGARVGYCRPQRACEDLGFPGRASRRTQKACAKATWKFCDVRSSF